MRFAGKAPRVDLALTKERLDLEEWAAEILHEWLKARVLHLVSAEVQKSMGAGRPAPAAIQGANRLTLDMMKAKQSGNWRPESQATLDAFQERLRERHGHRMIPEPPLPETVFDPGDRYRHQRPTIAAGEEVFGAIIEKARDLGAKEMASALLRDPNPPREYQYYTRRKLQILARKQVRLVDTTTKRLVRHITSHEKPDTVDQALHKLYSMARCRGIATDQTSKGYIRGAAEVLRQNGYRYIYWRTFMDERVCPICGPRESQAYTILEFLKQAPAHVRCRCWPSTTRFDGSRDPDLHAKSILVGWDQSIRRRRRRWAT